MIQRRKKICTKCGRKLWLRDFYRNPATGWLSSHCKECTREDKREEYNRNRKKPDGIFLDPTTGRAMEHRGPVTRIYWGKGKLDDLRRLFPTNTNEDCAAILGVSPRTVVRKARELGLVKNEEWRIRRAREACAVMRVYNMCRGNSGQFRKGEHASPATEFKPKIKTEIP